VAPGRCTIVGEHVDYAGGRVVAVAVDLTIRVAVRRSGDGRFSAHSNGRSVQRDSLDATPQRDIGDRIFGAAAALRDAGIAVPPFETHVTTTLPEAVGLASSAALICATMAALLRLCGRTMSRSSLIAAALHAERDLAGIPVGPLDPIVVVEAPPHGALLVDCAAQRATPLSWPWDDVVLCVCATGERHDVGGAGYRSRRKQVELDFARGDRSSPFARHVIEETARSDQAVVALRDDDATELGRLMSQSHASLRDLMEVSTAALDAVVSAAAKVDGVFGARLVGAGFGGSVVALCERRASERCRTAMLEAAGPECLGAWELNPAAGLAAREPDVVTDG